MPIPFDQSFKLISDDDPRALLAAFAGIPLEAPLAVTPLDSELNFPALRVDKLYQCAKPDEPPFLVHFEVVASFRTRTIPNQARYIRCIVSKHHLPVRSYLLLLRKDGVPASLDRWYSEDFTDHRSRTRIRTVRVWRLPARRLLALGRAVLYPWTVLANAKVDEIAEAAIRLRRGHYEDYFLQLCTLCGLQYGEDNPFVQEINHMPMDEVLQESSFYQKLVAKWNQDMEARLNEGLLKGHLEGHRDSLDRVLKSRFAPLPAWASQRIASASNEELSVWLEHAATAATLDTVFAPISQ
ncbi:MAG: hypothetical protein HYX27_01465 [Acidobacteria bacterium]|nr:hypothetical protein [Acidobacteriota bacterium]